MIQGSGVFEVIAGPVIDRLGKGCAESERMKAIRPIVREKSSIPNRLYYNRDKEFFSVESKIQGS